MNKEITITYIPLQIDNYDNIIIYDTDYNINFTLINKIFHFDTSINTNSIINTVIMIINNYYKSNKYIYYEKDVEISYSLFKELKGKNKIVSKNFIVSNLENYKKTVNNYKIYVYVKEKSIILDLTHNRNIKNIDTILINIEEVTNENNILIAGVLLDKVGVEKERIGYDNTSTTQETVINTNNKNNQNQGTSENSETPSVPPEDVDINPDDFNDRPNPFDSIFIVTTPLQSSDVTEWNSIMDISFIEPDEYYKELTDTKFYFTSNKNDTDLIYDYISFNINNKKEQKNCNSMIKKFFTEIINYFNYLKTFII